MVSATSILGASRLLVAVMGYASTIVIVKHTTPNVYGQYALIFSILALLGVVFDLQMGRVIYSALAEDPDPAAIGGSYVQLRLALGVAAYVCAMIIVLSGGYPHDVVAGMSVAGLTMLTGNLLNPLGVVLVSRRLFVAGALSSIVGQVAQVLLVIAIATGHIGPVIVMFSATAVANDAIVALLQYRFVRGSFRLRVRPRLRLWRVWIAEIALLAIGGALTVAYYRVDMVLLSKLGTFRSVGYYSLSDKLSSLLGYLPVAYVGVIVPVLVNGWADDRERFSRAFRQAMVLGLATAVGLVVLAVSFVPQIVTLLYGGRYAQIDPATRWLFIAEGMHFVTILSFFTLQAIGRNRGYPAVVLGALVVNVLVNLLVIPRYDYLGAAIVTAGTEIAVAAGLLLLVVRTPETRPIPIRPFLISLASAAPAAGLRYAVGDAIPWPVLAAIVALVYVAGLHLLRVDGAGGLPALVRSARLGNQGEGAQP